MMLLSNGKSMKYRQSIQRRNGPDSMPQTIDPPSQFLFIFIFNGLCVFRKLIGMQGRRGFPVSRDS
jgi:hypothetical protein